MGQAVEASRERERHASSEARTDLIKRAEGAEKRGENLQSNTKELTQKLRDTERRFQKVNVFCIKVPFPLAGTPTDHMLSFYVSW